MIASLGIGQPRLVGVVRSHGRHPGGCPVSPSVRVEAGHHRCGAMLWGMAELDVVGLADAARTVRTARARLSRAIEARDRAIVEAVSSGMSQSAVARVVGVNQAIVSRLVTREKNSSVPA